jgi:hypothetical protein
MSCKSCGSTAIRDFNGEIAIHFPGLEGLNKPIVWVFPKVTVCLNCGSSEFCMPEDQRKILGGREADGAGPRKTDDGQTPKAKTG